jgi:hypothetical protein
MVKLRRKRLCGGARLARARCLRQNALVRRRPLPAETSVAAKSRCIQRKIAKRALAKWSLPACPGEVFSDVLSVWYWQRASAPVEARRSLCRYCYSGLTRQRENQCKREEVRSLWFGPVNQQEKKKDLLIDRPASCLLDAANGKKRTRIRTQNPCKIDCEVAKSRLR